MSGFRLTRRLRRTVDASEDTGDVAAGDTAAAFAFFEARGDGAGLRLAGVTAGCVAARFAFGLSALACGFLRGVGALRDAAGEVDTCLFRLRVRRTNMSV